MYKNLLLQPDKVDLVIYHGRCSDGLTSALAAHEYFKKTNGVNSNGNTVEYYSASFNQPPPDVTNKNVLICDFSYNKQITLNIIANAKCLAIIDHHESAEKALKDIDDKYKIFDMLHSGAYLTWKYFYPNSDVPLFVKYVEDNDIWLKQMPQTEEMTCYTYSLPFEFEEYAKLLDPTYIETVAKPIGSGMKRQNDIYIRDALTHCTCAFTKIGEEHFVIAYINSTILKSEIGNKALTKYPYCDFSAIYSLDGDITTFSLRSSNDKTNVSEISTKFGGGGHRNAAGMSVYNSSILPVHHVDHGSIYRLLESNFITVASDNIIVAKIGSHSPRVIGKYLMQITQEKLNDGTIRPLQKCCAILRVKLSNDTLYNNYGMCITESNFDQFKNEYNLFFDSLESAKKIYNSVSNNFKEIGIIEKDNRIRIVCGESKYYKLIKKLHSGTNSGVEIIQEESNESELSVDS